MATWTVHAPEGDLGAAIAADRLVFAREGFAWWALWLPFLWAPFHRLWLVSLGWLGVAASIQAIDVLVSEVAGTVLSLAFALWFAAEAQDLRRWTLERRGWRLIGLASGADLDEAEARFFAKLAAGPGIDLLPPVPPPAPRFDTPFTPPRDLPPIVGFAGVPGDRP